MPLILWVVGEVLGVKYSFIPAHYLLALSRQQYIVFLDIDTYVN